jgi:NADPH2:quinone reductase
MKAAAYSKAGPPSVLVYQDVPDPICGPRDVVIDVHAISIEGGDVLSRARGVVQPDGAPHVGGYLAAGVICEVGAEVTDRHVGQRVATSAGTGSHASKRAVRANSAWPVPDSLDLKLAACIPIPFGTADDCLFEFGRLKAGESVLIHAGSSGVGLAAIQLAKRAGATVIATASSEDRLGRLKDLGLDHGVDYSRDDWVDRVRELTGGRGVDLVVDSVGGRILAGSVQCLAYRGRCITVGSAGRDPQPFDAGMLSMGNQSLTGVFLGAEIATPRAQAMIGALIDDVAAGRLHVEIDRTYPLAEAAAAHAYVESRQAVGRVVLIP